MVTTFAFLCLGQFFFFKFVAIISLDAHEFFQLVVVFYDPKQILQINLMLGHILITAFFQGHHFGLVLVPRTIEYSNIKFRLKFHKAEKFRLNYHN